MHCGHPVVVQAQTATGGLTAMNHAQNAAYPQAAYPQAAAGLPHPVPPTPQRMHPDGRPLLEPGLLFSVGRVLGLVMAPLGAFLWGIAIWMLADSGSTFRVLLAGPALLCWGLSLLIAPGAPVSVSRNRSYLKAGGEDNWWLKESPLWHKIVWGVAAGIGLILGIGTLFA